MLGPRLRSVLNTVLVVVGALVIGGALHLSLVRGQVSLTAPVTLGRIALGLVLIGVGYWIRVPTDEQVPDEEEDLDPDLSPLDDEG